MSLDPQEMKLLGASDMPVLLGLSPWSGPVALWARIVHGWEPAATRDMEAGNAAEDYNRALYRQATGYTLSGPSKWRHPLYPWLRCSPDDTAVDTPAGRQGVELKRYNKFDGWGAEGTGDVPEDIWAQVQFQGGVALELGHWDTGDVDVSGLLRGEHRLYRVEHAPEVYERCIELGERFWRDFVLPQRCPDGDNLVLLERDAQAIRALFPAPVSEECRAWESLSERQQEALRGWLEANAARKAWAKREKELAPLVEFALREAPGLELPEGMSARRVDYKVQAGQARTDLKALREALRDEDPAFARRMLELLERFTTKETTRPLVAR
jgi:hypothetical protein